MVFKPPKISLPFKRIGAFGKGFTQLTSLFFEYCGFLATYTHEKVVSFGRIFEQNKNLLVKFFLMKRGRYNRPFLHITAMVVMGLGVLIAPLLADTYPVFSGQSSMSPLLAQADAQSESIIVGEDVFQTKISQKPRDEIVTYSVQNGDTLSTIAEKFQISQDTIKWTNDLKSDDLTVGDELKILPVTGMSHKVASGDTVYSIAKKYQTNPQAIVDFPFNDFANPETFSLVAGQILIVPDGVKPSAAPVVRRQYIAAGPAVFSNTGYAWPVQGIISQFAAWYHMALDITSPVGTPIIASQNGTVTKALAGTWDGGYGTNVMVSDGAGTDSLYAHMSGLNVSVGDDVVAGKTVVGWVGLTGRTTGAHLHFEIHKNGVLVNPLSYLQ